MDMVIPHDLSQKFTSAREDLHKLKAGLDKVQAMIDTDHLIPDDLSMEVFSSLSSCRASKSALTEALEKYAVSAAFSMQEMEQAIMAALDGEAMRTLLVDYFRLTSDAETVLARLNDAKKALQAQCSLPRDELKAILAPYQVMVDYASGKKADVTDDESQLIEQVMGRSISRALDKGQIRLGDIEEGERWLAGVADTAAAVAVTADCQEPMAPVVEEPVPPAVDQAPAQGPAAMEGPTPADTPEDAEAAKADETAAHEPAGAADAAPLEEALCGEHDSEAPEQSTALWADFQGYVQEGSVTVDDVPANRFRASDFQSMARKHKVRADVLATKIREILQKNNEQSYLIIVNCALSLQERRKLARLVSGGMMQSSFVILDRALALYLASIPQAERWKALLQCSLPFQVINPYSENSAVEIPPEMFIGRTRELDSFRRPDGANLIYGGRQLGKTALLKRARVLEHRPSADSWAVYEDIKNKKSAEASVRIAKTLTQEKFFDHLPDVHSWEDLLDVIGHQLMEVHQQRKLLLLLDEGDVFLAAGGQNKYTEIDGWKQLQDRTGNRFKCVMAGLHNVLRLNNSMALTANSTLPHMHGLTVEPLDFKDARALLEIPLSYLGFTIPEEDEDIITQILYNTNYFPGLVHFYASRLVEYAKTHANEMREPPYELRTETLLSLLAEKNFHDLRNDRIRMTLYIDANEHSYYDILATTMCYGYNISEDYKLLGMTADDIQHECTSLTPNCSIASLTNAQLRALLDELVTLNIFRVENDRYQFRRPSFTEIFDSPDAVEQHFLKVLEREAT